MYTAMQSCFYVFHSSILIFSPTKACLELYTITFGIKIIPICVFMLSTVGFQ